MLRIAMQAGDKGLSFCLVLIIIEMAYDFKKFKQHAEKTENWFQDEISLLRTGRATPALIENIKVDYFGAKSPLKGVASTSVEDARTLVVKPWDTDMIMPVEQAIANSELGLQAITEKDFVRVIFPELTEERRQSLLKILREKVEEAKVSLRREREDIWKDVQRKEKDGEISEDEKFRGKDELQKLIDESSRNIDETAFKKENEIKN
ncbi:ribosome recycling factor [Patescibacteria group bacterium]